MTGFMHEKEFSRKAFVKGGGALVVGFGLALPGAALAKSSARRSAEAIGGPWTTPSTTALDSWIQIGQDGKVTVFTGSIDTGQGKHTGFAQIVADELDAPFEAITIVPGDTAKTPTQGGSGGGNGIIALSQPVRYAAAEARFALLKLASTRFGVPVDQLSVSDGVVSVANNPSQHVSYGDLIGSNRFSVTLSPMDMSNTIGYAAGSIASVFVTQSGHVKPSSAYKVIGTSPPRVDIPEKVTGRYTYAQNIRVPGMVHARLVLPPSPTSNLVAVNGFKGTKPPGIIDVFTKGNLVAVIAEQEWAAIQGASTLRVTWSDPSASLSGNGNLFSAMRTQTPVAPDVTTWRDKKIPSEFTDPNRGNVASALASAAHVLQADYNFPIQCHGSIGPACAVADVSNGQAIVWSHTQQPFGDQTKIATTIGVPTSNVRVIWVEGAGQYGRGWDEDAGAAAALLSQHVGRPVRLQLMRWDDFQSEAYGTPYSVHLKGGVDSNGNIVGWSTEIWNSAVNSATEGPTLTALLTTLAPSGAMKSNSFHSLGGADFSNYEFPNESLIGHFPLVPLRFASFDLRSPARIQNNFAVESFIDELASAAGADPIEFRLKQLQTTQQIAKTLAPTLDQSNYQRVTNTLTTLRDAMKWDTRVSPNRAQRNGDVVTGRGVAMMANYNNTFGSMGAEVEVNLKTGKINVTKLTNVVDAGIIINPRAARDTIARGVIFALSRTMREQLQFDKKRVLSRDWVTYPILRFVDIPDQEVILLKTPAPWGGGLGEGNEIMVPAAIGNAVFDATGVRLREVPFTPARVRAAFPAAGVKA